MPVLLHNPVYVNMMIEIFLTATIDNDKGVVAKFAMKRF